jgi:hypothetical protein
LAQATYRNKAAKKMSPAPGPTISDDSELRKAETIYTVEMILLDVQDIFKACHI